MTTTLDLITCLTTASENPGGFSEQERAKLVAACEKFRVKIENPRDALLRVVFAPHQSIALRLAVDMKLFDAASNVAGDGGPVNIEDLASEAGADSAFVSRIMRFLVGMGIFSETGPGTFALTPLAKACVTGSPLTEAVIHMTSQNEIISTLPSYFAANGYTNPSDAYAGPFQSARNTDKHCFDWLATQPRLQHAFNVAMGISRSTAKERWFDMVPVEKKLANDGQETVLVDVGGGDGHDIIAFKEKFLDIKGRLIVQDIPVVIDSVDAARLPKGIEAMAHDFFKPQPVRNAKAYYLGHVVHDWPDREALTILGNIREAMGPGSMLFIHENMLPETGVSMYSASTDLIMMASFASLERTRRQFEELLDRAGFLVVQIWSKEDGRPGGGVVIEAVVKKG